MFGDSDAEEGEQEDGREEEVEPVKLLFQMQPCLVQGAKDVVLEFVVLGTHDEDFGELFLRITKGDKTIYLRKYKKFIEFLSLHLKDKKKLLEGRPLGILNNASYYFDDNDNLILFTHSDHDFGLVGSKSVILSRNEQRKIRRKARCLAKRRYLFELLSLNTIVAKNDIITECKFKAQRRCKACREKDAKTHQHTCISVRGKVLDEWLEEALDPDDKWPWGAAITEIYKRLAEHVDFFKQEFRLSVYTAKHLTQLYKTDNLPSFVL